MAPFLERFVQFFQRHVRLAGELLVAGGGSVPGGHAAVGFLDVPQLLVHVGGYERAAAQFVDDRAANADVGVGLEFHFA